MKRILLILSWLFMGLAVMAANSSTEEQAEQA